MASAVDVDAFPWPVLVVNMAGSFVLGAALAEQWIHPGLSVLLRDGVGVGFARPCAWARWHGFSSGG